MKHNPVDEALFEATWPTSEIVLIRIKRHLLDHASILRDKQIFFDFFDAVAEDSMTKCVVLMGHPEKRGAPEFEEWIERVMKARHEPLAVQRVVNAFQQFVMRILTLPQLVLYGDAGMMTMNYLSVGLAADFFVLGEGVRIQNPNAEHGILPAGGTAHFLREQLGGKRVLALLASAEELTAEEACSMGLCQGVCVPQELENRLLTQARVWAQHHPNYLRSLKAATRSDLQALDDWFKKELEAIVRGALWT